MTPLTLLDYPLDKEYMLALAQKLRDGGESYSDSRLGTQSWDHWKIARFSDDPYVDKVMKDFGVHGKPRFYYQKANSVLRVHTDFNTTCSLNFILSEDPAPVQCNGVDYFYKQCLLNVTVPHGVVNGPVERLLFKISLFDEPYEELAERIPYKIT